MKEPYTDLQNLIPQNLRYRLTCSTGAHNKFYEIYTIPISTSNRYDVVCRYGRIGTDGVAVIRSKNALAYSCNLLVTRLRNGKISKGYIQQVNVNVKDLPLVSKPIDNRNRARVNLLEID